MLYFVLIIVIMTIWLFVQNSFQKQYFHKGEMEQEWIDFLIKHVEFYKRLNDIDKYKYERNINQTYQRGCAHKLPVNL